MSSIFLSKNQRELVKFLKPYVLYTHRRKKGRRRVDSDLTINARLNPTEEALLDFKPDENEIDGKLYDGIVETNLNKSVMHDVETSADRSNLQIHIDELDKQPARNSRFICENEIAHLKDSRHSSQTSGASESDSSSEDEHF